MIGQKEGTYNIMRKLKIGEISSVDRPAQGDGARLEIIKRADQIEKRHALLDPMDGHSHTLSYIADDTKGESSWAGDPDHSHPWIHGMNGELIVGYANGHTHRVGFFSKDANDSTPVADATNPPEDNTMNEEQFKAKLEEINKQLEEVQKNLESERRVSTLNDAQRAHFAKMSEVDERNAFLDLDSEARDVVVNEAIAKASESDPVVATTEEGVEIRKSQDPTGLLAAMVLEKAKDKKKLFEAEEKAKDEKMKAEKAELEKRAASDDYANLPGTPEMKAEMLKAIDGIEDEEVRKSAHEALVAKNEELSSAFKEVGTVGSPDPIVKSLSDKLDVIRDAILKEQPELSKSQAYVKAIETKEGLEIYAEMQNPQEAV